MTRPNPAILAAAMAINRPRLMLTVKAIQEAIKADERAAKK